MPDSRVRAVFLAALVVLSAIAVPLAFAGAAAADAHTNATSIQDGDTVSNFNASTDTEYYVAIAESDTAGTAETIDHSDIQNVELELEYENATHLEMARTFENTSPSGGFDLVQGATDYGAGTDEDGTVHGFVFDESDLETVPVEPNTNTTLDGTITYEESDGTEHNVTFQVTLDGTDDRTVLYYEDDAGEAVSDSFSDDIDHTERDPAVWQVLTDDVSDHYVVDDVTANTTDHNTTVHVYMDGDMADDWADAAEGMSTEDTMFAVTGLEDDDLHWVFYKEADDDIVDTDEDSYFVYDDSDDRISFHPGTDDHENVESVELRAANHGPTAFDDVSFFDVRDTFGTVNAINALVLFVSLGSVLAGGLVVARREE